MTQYLAHQVMTPCDVIEIDELASVAKAIVMFDDHNISAMPVKNHEGKHVGVISKSDIARRRFLEAVRLKSSPDSLMVRHFMNKTLPISVAMDTTIDEVIRIMHRRGIHRVFVKNQNEKLCGVLSATNIIKVLHIDAEHTLSEG